MPSPKKKKNNEEKDNKQMSLFSFTKETPTKELKKKEETPSKNVKPEATKKKTPAKPKVAPKKKPVKKEEKQPDKSIKPGIISKSSEKIPEELFFRDGGKLFGLAGIELTVPQLKRESYTSKYIRFLKETGGIVENLNKGLLLDIDYDGGENKAFCKFYDLETDEIKIWLDTTDHEPYCLSKEKLETLKILTYSEKLGKQEVERKMTDYEGFNHFEQISRTDLLTDKEIDMVKIYGKTPTNIGGSGTNIRNILAENGFKAWEADIRYHLNYIFDRQLIPGLIYSIKKGTIKKIQYEETSEELKTLATELRDLFKEEKPEIQEFSEKFLDIFLTPIPDVKRLAFDIEVNLGERDYRIPDPRLAEQEVISVSFVASDGFKAVYMLEREGYVYKEPFERFPKDAKIVFFKSEKKLLEETFRLLWEYPVVLSFNGDNFDLNYLFHRANKLKINRDLNPIHVKRGFGILSKAECDLRNGIHIDLFNFFFNRSIAGYAFSGAYESASLNAISAALLGKEKYQHEEEIHEMEYDVLSWYNLKDSLLTLELTKFNNSLVWNLIIILCRITKLPIHEMVRRQISTWIQNIFYFEHRRRGYLIPRRSEISEVKRGGKTGQSVIDGKGFQGAYVVEPVPGIHYDVVVMDFASLYPSIIKEYNLSYETVLCPHEDCQDNLVRGTPYPICTHKMGIFAYVVGFFRDIRVKYFKPKSGDKKLTEKQRSYYNTIQQALKVFINASYGVFGSKNFPLFCLPVAESITGRGQYSIKQTIKKSEEIGVKVLYGDTDSVFLLNPSNSQMKQISEWSKEELDLDLEEEKTYQFLALSERKKNYIGIYRDTKYIDLKGLVAKKKNTPEFIKKVYRELLEILKEVTNDDQFSKAKKDIQNLILTNFKKIGKKNMFSLEDYAINITMQKQIEQYNKTIPQHVRAAQELKKITGKEYQKGETIRFIKSKDKIGAKVIELATLKDIDVKKYKELLKSALEQFIDALGIGIDILSYKTLEFQKLDGFV